MSGNFISTPWNVADIDDLDDPNDETGWGSDIEDDLDITPDDIIDEDDFDPTDEEDDDEWDEDDDLATIHITNYLD